jgi:UrcA family protein
MSLFLLIIGRKSALYQLRVLPKFSPGPQPPLIAITAQHTTERTPMKTRIATKAATIMASLAVLATGFHAPASAETWKVGSTFVVRHRHLDLDRPADRLALLVQVERSAARLCEGVRIKAKRRACTESYISESLQSAPAEVRAAVQTARLERDGQQQAQR